MSLTNLGKELRKVRLDHGITLFEMAEKIGISSSMLSSVETGRKPAPAGFIDRLAKHFNEVNQHRNSFMALADQTVNEVKVKLGERPNANAVALAFARNFDSMSDSQLSELMAVFERKK